ncbi:MAG: hypothetical protein HZC17_08720 [Candidatus Omnitrophica bacterium]|nr:hypothetical protein [Candidatus Omnitrophota bacterium]
MRQFLTWSLLFAGLMGFVGCESVDSKLTTPEGRNSENDRYKDDDVVGPVLKFSLKPTPQQQEQEAQQVAQKSLDPDY